MNCKFCNGQLPEDVTLCAHCGKEQEAEQVADEVTEEVFESYLDTHGIPDPDLLIRTSGELRLSNYLLWQIAYAELEFVQESWPEFTPDVLKRCLDEFTHRDRRFGGVKNV